MVVASPSGKSPATASTSRRVPGSRARDPPRIPSRTRSDSRRARTNADAGRGSMATPRGPAATSTSRAIPSRQYLTGTFFGPPSEATGLRSPACFNSVPP